MSNPYEACLNDGHSENALTLAQCLSDQHEQVQRNLNNTYPSFSYGSPEITIPFALFTSSLVFFMQAGFAMVCAGSVRKKNVQNTALKNLLDLCGSAVAFYSVGYAFAFGDPDTNSRISFIGSGNFFLSGMTDDETGLKYSYWVFQFSFAATSATIVAGTLAERCQMKAYLLYSMLLTGFVYPVIVHAIWSENGFLNYDIENPLLGSGMIDFAGSGVVHLTGGCTALIASKLLGPRKGRFYDDRGILLEEPKNFPGHSKALQMLGTFILWFGWIGFNAGGAIHIDGSFNPAVTAVAVVNTIISGSMAGIAALVTNLIYTERLTGEPHYNLGYAMNGCLCGLTAITGSCGVIEPWSAVVIGTFAGLLFLATSKALERFLIDDAVDAIPVHLAGGMWGLIAAGLFASPTGMRRYDDVEVAEHVGLFYNFGDGSLIACQVLGIIFIVIWVTAIMLPFFFILNYLGLFRADTLEELVGLDVSYHGWTSAVVDDVTQEQLDEYSNKSSHGRRNEERWGSRNRGNENEDDDNDCIDRFE